MLEPNVTTKVVSSYSFEVYVRDVLDENEKRCCGQKAYVGYVGYVGYVEMVAGLPINLTN